MIIFNGDLSEYCHRIWNKLDVMKDMPVLLPFTGLGGAKWVILVTTKEEQVIKPTLIFN